MVSTDSNDLYKSLCKFTKDNELIKGKERLPIHIAIAITTDD